MDEQTTDLAKAALGKIESVLAAQDSESEFQHMADVARMIVRMRDGLIAQLRAPSPHPDVRERLDRVNQLVSMTAAAELPLQGIHWDRIKKTRDLLAEMAGAAAR